MEKERELAVKIVGLFEDLLDKYGIDIPSEERNMEIKDMTDEEITEAGFSHLYGADYYRLEDEITELLKNR